MEQAGISTAHLDAEVLLSFVLHLPRETVATYLTQTLSSSETQVFERLIKKRIARVPVAYLLGVKEFYGREFTVNKHVMIPRPVTEEMVERLLTLPFCSLADIGTGSGCIAITVACEKTETTIIATDNDRQALKVAKHNAKKNHAKNITFLRGNLAEKILDPVDVMVANLPYLPATLPPTPEMTFEPKQALYGGHQGCELIVALVQHIRAKKVVRQAIFLEIDPQSAKTLEKTFCKDFDVARFAQDHFIELRPRST